MNLFEFLILILVLAWFTGTVVFPVGNLIHLLLVVAVILFILRLLEGTTPRL